MLQYLQYLYENKIGINVENNYLYHLINLIDLN